jgi:hypothetical protein
MSAIPYGLKADIAREQAAWQVVGAAFHNGSDHCSDCGWCMHSGQHVPYGEGEAYEMRIRCGLRRPHSPNECPAYREYLANEAEEQDEKQ